MAKRHPPEVTEYIKRCLKDGCKVTEVQKRVKNKFQLDISHSTIYSYKPDSKYGTISKRHAHNYYQRHGARIKQEIREAREKKWKEYCQQEYKLTEFGRDLFEASYKVDSEFKDSMLIRFLAELNGKGIVRLETIAEKLCPTPRSKGAFKMMVNGAYRKGYITLPDEEFPAEIIEIDATVLEDKITNTIFNYLNENPGAYPGKISHDLIINSTVTRNNLKILESSGLIASMKIDKHVCYYSII